MLDIWLFWRFDLLIGKNFDSIAVMSTVSEIIEAVKKLPEREKSEFLERLAEVDFEVAWDRQIRVELRFHKNKS
jgi:hypothetical protein